MAEFDELDGLLRDALGKAAEPGDSAGVADAIRSRLAAGDAGSSVAGSTAPGWGGGVSSWLPWLGLIVAAAIGGTALGASGLVGAPVGEPGHGPAGVVVGAAPAASCPGGPIIDELHAGDRVLAVQRSDDLAYLGVRDPRDLVTVLWLSASSVAIDDGQTDVSGLPIGACPVVVQTYVTPEPEPEPEPVDSTRPSISQAGSSAGTVYVMNNGTAVISAVASDNERVTSVSISWSGSTTGIGEMQFSGGTWSFLFDPPQDTPAGTVSFTIQARDAAGNVSAPATVNVQTVP
jgi:hypothetical protein